MMLLVSCTSKEDKLRDYVNNQLIERVEDYLISETVIKYIQEDALQAGVDKANYYYNHFDHDWSSSERFWASDFIGMSQATGHLKKMFEDRLSSYYAMISTMNQAWLIYGGVRGIKDSTFRFTSLLNVHHTCILLTRANRKIQVDFSVGLQYILDNVLQKKSAGGCKIGYS